MLLVAAKLLLDCWTGTDVIQLSDCNYLAGLRSLLASHFHLVFDLVFAILRFPDCVSSSFYILSFCENNASKRNQTKHISMSGGQKEFDKVKRERRAVALGDS